MVVTTNVFNEFWQHSQFVQFATSSDVIEKCCFIKEYSCHSSNSWLKRKGGEILINYKFGYIQDYYYFWYKIPKTVNLCH